MTQRELPVHSPASDPSGATDTGDARACEGCIGHADRRTFIGSVASALAVLAMEGFFPRASQALPVREVRRIATDGANVLQEATYPIPATDGVQFDKGEGVIIARRAGVVYAFSLSCPHQNTALRWNDSNATFQCPRHKSRYQADGTFISGRATRAMDRFALRRAGETVVVNLDSLYEQDTSAAAWGAAKVTL
ncbi:MAG: Rieske 2Fe-2S domain-containing protein [Gemmatimonadota bacterium]